MDDNDAVDEYIRHKDYGKSSDRKYLCFGVVFHTYKPGSWDYSMRWNVTQALDLLK